MSLVVNCLNPASGKAALVLLHGWGADQQVWGPWQQQLCEHFELYLLDLPGLGVSKLPESGSSVADIAAEIAPHLPTGCLLLGWSLGGLVAAELARQAPEKVLGVIGLCSNPSFIQQSNWPGMKAETFDLFAQGVEQQPAKTLQRFVLLQAQGGEQAKQVVKHLKTLYGQALPHGLSETLALLAEDARERFDALAIPLMWLLSEADHLVPVELASSLRERYPTATVAVIEQAGHLPFISHPEWLTEQLCQFADKALGRG